ncbi:MAG: FkbM family methyltransferase [Sneathiella sp.]
MTWQPPETFEEKLKRIFIPPQLYIRYRVGKELRVGEREIRLLPFLVDKNKTAVDIGAHKGVWSYLLSKICGEVYAFEPNPKLYPVLERNIKGRAVPRNIALSNFSGTAELRIPQGRKGFSNQGGSLSEVKVSANYKSVEVGVEKLDNLGLQNIGFMKVDVEGHELSVLEGASETIARDRPVMIVEMEENHAKRPIEELVSEVETYGYDAFAMKDGVLTRFWGIDMDKHHRNAQKRSDYIFNFIFLPSHMSQ